MIKRVVGDLGSIVADAQERGLVAQNVVRSLGRHKRRQDERRQKVNLKIGIDIPTLDEVRAVIAHPSVKGRVRGRLRSAFCWKSRSTARSWWTWCADSSKPLPRVVAERQRCRNSP